MKLNKRGISLIVLVITIIVMLILATAIILSLSGSDMRNKANEAVNATDISTAKEVVAVAQSEWELNYDELKDKYEHLGAYANEKLQKTGISSVKVSKDGAVNTVYKDKNGDTAIIPEGFNVSNIESEQTVEYGLVIIDKKGNEFVWVPVDDMNLFKRTTTFNGTITALDSTVLEPYTGSAVEVEEYNAMYASVQENKGFYIARYEAGKEGTNTVVSKKGATVWCGITWGTSMTEVGTEGAVYRARQMYKGSKSIVSTLCYGVQWDSALQFISTRGIKDTTYATDSRGKGYYAYDENWNQINPEEVQVAGSNDAYSFNNIYDMAGNASEWTMEVLQDFARFTRGCYLLLGGSDYSASYREPYYPTEITYNQGFRVCLYVK